LNSLCISVVNAPVNSRIIVFDLQVFMHWDYLLSSGHKKAAKILLLTAMYDILKSVIQRKL